MRSLIFLILLCSALPLKAADITLTAEERVEYYQKEQKLVAKGRAVATKGKMRIKAETLVGFYNPKVKNKLSHIEAYPNVIINTPQAEAFGNQFNYDAHRGTAILTGTPAKIKTEDALITAKGSITYDEKNQKAVVKDNIEVTHSKGTKIFADLMTAYFKKDSTGKLQLDHIDIEKNVKITSKGTIVTAQRGAYTVKTGVIDLFEDVVITQDGNILKGSHAETNTKTGISKLVSSDGTSSGRVSGVFKEKSKKD